MADFELHVEVDDCPNMWRWFDELTETLDRLFEEDEFPSPWRATLIRLDREIGVRYPGGIEEPADGRGGTDGTGVDPLDREDPPLYSYTD